jgi:hypothetical protein
MVFGGTPYEPASAYDAPVEIKPAYSEGGSIGI